jgi:putative membrane protein
MQAQDREPLVLLAVAAAALIVSGVAPHDRVTWWLEVLPVLVGAPILIATYRRFRLGFVPAILAREILIRRSPLAGSRWLFFLVVCVCLAFSAFYELTEWWTALAGGSAADAFLGTQGDVWDTQWDMFLALTGALSAQLLLGRWHDRQIAEL